MGHFLPARVSRFSLSAESGFRCPVCPRVLAIHHIVRMHRLRHACMSSVFIGCKKKKKWLEMKETFLMSQLFLLESSGIKLSKWRFLLTVCQLLAHLCLSKSPNTFYRVRTRCLKYFNLTF